MKYETNGILIGILLGAGLFGLSGLAGAVAGVACGALIAIGMIMFIWGVK